MEKIKITRTLTKESLKKLQQIAHVNGLDESKALDIIIKQVKKIKLI